MRAFILRFFERIGLIAHRSSLLPGQLAIWDIREYTLLLNVSSSNNLIEIDKQGEQFFFRFTSPRSSKRCIIAATISKYERLTGLELTEIKNELLPKRNAKLFRGMGDFSPSSRIYKCFKYRDLRLVGLDECILGSLKERDVWGFLYFAWSEICTFKKNRWGGEYQLFSYNRSRCQQKIYELFGVPHLICGVELLKIIGHQDSFIGSIMHTATGVNPLTMKKDEIRNKLSPLIIRDLNTLTVLDALCNERDHRPGNYNVVLDNRGDIVSIQAFDNDSDLSFFPFISVNRPLRGCPGLVGNDGCMVISHLDKSFVTHFLSVSPEDLQKVVKPYLNSIQLVALLIRFKKIRKSLLKTLSDRIGFVKEVNEWSENDLEFELSLESNNNYTKLLANWCEEEKDPVLLAQNKWEKRPIVF